MPTPTPTLLSIQVGRPRDMLLESPRDGRPIPWRSGIFKSPITTPVLITQDGIEGDAQDDLHNHGGPDNIVLAYAASHYADWQRELNRQDLSPGSFGENFTVQGFTDNPFPGCHAFDAVKDDSSCKASSNSDPTPVPDSASKACLSPTNPPPDDIVCIGDIWQVGSGSGDETLTLQITQPRQPCFKLARRLEQPDIVQRVRDSSRGGWYLRVLTPGTAHAGMPITRTARLHPGWPVARAVQVMYNRKISPAPARELAQLPELSARWKDELLTI